MRDLSRPGRRSIRLKEYDYASPGAYFVTVCVQGRVCFLGRIALGELTLNDAGRMVEEVWQALPGRFANLDLGEYVVMPNHFHGLIILGGPAVGAPLVGAPDASPPSGAGTSPAPTPTARLVALSDVVGAFKSITTREYMAGVRARNWPAFTRRLWQRNYWERVVRDEEELHAVRAYILQNPARWAEDRDNLSNTKRLPPFRSAEGYWAEVTQAAGG